MKRWWAVMGIWALAAGAGAVAPALGPARPPVVVNWPQDACPPPTMPLERAVWNVVRARGGSDVSCGNAFVGYLRTPQDLDTPEDAFSQIARQVEGARREVLLTSMEWQGGEGRPGWTLAQAVGALYRRLQATPGAYPDGLTVRLLLGGVPQLGPPGPPEPLLTLARDLRAAGVPFADPARGWTVTLLNYASFPHSHVKLHVIDGEDVTAAGFNFTVWHLPATQPGGRNLHDLGLRLRGPVAQAGVAAFDDLWRRSEALQCPPQVAPEEVAAACTLGPAPAPSHPPAAAQAQPAGQARAWLLYRRPGGEQMADDVQLALLGAAQRSIDLMQADFSPGLACWYGYLHPEGCAFEDLPVYFGAVMSALERGVQVRLLAVNYGVGAPANRTGVALLRREMRRRGIPDERFEARYVDFAMHTKALTVDRQMVVVGSMNYHFSAWGTLGLAEAALATSDPAAVAEQEASFETVWRSSSAPVPLERWLRRP
ncbi:phospholipase D-like domain-containing protein [Deinococcus multiflagellatus]|nr:phospholipase D-like domain-containing protein [Deinococcus multiflagellatus]MBZ9713007.1 phospholipase D-like domain-containing protein [Deinococcus multiflagellatus]